MRAPIALLALISLAACQTGGPIRGSGELVAAAIMHDRNGQQLGQLVVTEAPAGIRLMGTLRGLTAGTHGIHLHAVGRCEAPFTSAGPHWNPATRQHGFDNPGGAHLGDLPNITVGADGTAQVDVTSRGGTLAGTGGALDGDGLAVVVHAAADDYRTDPSGNSGDRIACGVVGVPIP